MPDTPADHEIRSALDASPPRSFVVVAGAGSGKTTSLIKALDHVIRVHKERLVGDGRRVACITYTEVAAQEIASEVGDSDLIHVSTIHSLLWSLVSPFSTDIGRWVVADLQGRIEEREARLSDPGTRQSSRNGIEEDIANLRSHLETVPGVRSWMYGSAANYKKGILGHADIIKMVPMLILNKRILAKVVAQCFPFVFVDESQDADPTFVEALKHVAKLSPSEACLGFFGDPMQQIYMSGIGEIERADGWVHIEKPENYRCSAAVLGVVNAVRCGGDELVQIAGGSQSRTGTARLYVIPSDEKRNERFGRLLEHLAREDEGWQQRDAVRVLVIAHRMAARRLGFGALHEAANDKAPESIRNPFAEGNLWILRPLRDYLVPLADAYCEDRDNDVISLLRRNSLLLEHSVIARTDVRRTLVGAKGAVKKIAEVLSQESSATIRQVLRLAVSSELMMRDPRVLEHLQDPSPSGTDADDETRRSEENVLGRILDCPATEVRPYIRYIERESPYATQHGVKGVEFERVIVILDDEEGRFSSYSYDKLFRLKPLSKRDQERVAEQGGSVMDRTRRLFYVCCSRARDHLVVVYFAHQPEQAAAAIRQTQYFPTDQIEVFDRL